MNVEHVGEALAAGNLDPPAFFPRQASLRDAPAVFRVEMGLDGVPVEPGVLPQRGGQIQMEL
jgi:hypothetical protein